MSGEALASAQPQAGHFASTTPGGQANASGGEPAIADTAEAPLGRLGELEVRLAASITEVRRAQSLRYAIFYGEMSAIPNLRTTRLRRDEDVFDAACDHLLVYDRSPGRRGRGHGYAPAELIGACRLLRREAAERLGGFYTEQEFELAPLLRRKPNLHFLELGRSCVLPGHRDKRALELLWHGIWRYVLMHRIDVMIGCASLAGTDPERLALPLSFLHYFASAPADWSVAARRARRIAMDRISLAEINPKAAIRSLPPLVKGYLRLGAWVGDGAVVDRQFGTTDVCIVLPVSAINRRYVNHFGADAGRYAA